MGAGPKFDNHKFYFGDTFDGKYVDDRVDLADLKVVCATEKSSGSMIRLIAHPLNYGEFVAGTKNGTEDKFLFTFQNVFKKQFGDDLSVALWNFLRQTGWTLNFELVTSTIVSPNGHIDHCSHGSKPLTDHIIIHGGTKQNQDILNPLDLYQMKVTIARDWGKETVQGLYFPHCTFFGVNGCDDLLSLEKAFIEVNNKVVFPRVRNVAPCLLDDAASLMEGGNYYFWQSEFCSEARKRGIFSCQVFDHDSGKVDNADVLEGWVMHYVSGDMLTGSYAVLDLCLDQLNMVFDCDKIPAVEGITTTRLGGVPECKILMGYSSDARKLTIEEMLGEYAAGPVLKDFLWDLLCFVESKQGIMGGMTKRSFFIQLATLPDADAALMTVTMRGEHQWYLYEEFCKKRPPSSCIKLSRGFSILLTTNPSYAMEEPDWVCDEKRDTRDKWKLGHYMLHTRVLRPHCSKNENVSKKPLSCSDEFKKLFDLGFLTRWGLVKGVSRFEALKYLYLMAAYCSSIIAKEESNMTYLDKIEDMMAKLSFPNSRRSECVAWLGLYADVRKSELMPSPSACGMIEKLGDGCDLMFEMAVMALEDPTNIPLHALMGDIELGLGILSQPVSKAMGGGFMYDFVRDNKKVTSLKGRLVPLLLLIQKYNWDFICRNSKTIETLKLVIAAGTPGMGKSTYLNEVGRQLNEISYGGVDGSQCIVMGVDTFPGNTAKERLLNLFSEFRACNESDPSINMLILDRCCVDVSSLGLRNVFPDKILDIHMLIPDHGATAVQGNECDWFLPFSLDQIAVNACSALVRKHNNGQMPALNAVEGARGFDLAVEHIVSARASRSIEKLAREELRSLAGSFSVSYFRYVDEGVVVPWSIMIAIQLSVGMNLSRSTRQVIENSLKKKVEAADGVILKTLALSLQDVYGRDVDSLECLLSEIMTCESESNIMGNIWPKWLNGIMESDAKKYLSVARLPMQATVGQMVGGIRRLSTATPIHTQVRVMHFPFVPQYFGIQVSNSMVVKCDLKGKFFVGGSDSARLYVRDGDIHVTSLVPTMSLSEFSDGIIRSHVTAAIQKKTFNFRIEKIVSGPTTNAATVTVLSGVDLFGDKNGHVTLICAGANKDSTAENLIQTTVDCGVLARGFYVGKIRAPSVFGLY